MSKWNSYKHPDNPSFQQTVNWSHFQKPDGSSLLVWSLDFFRTTKYYMYNVPLEEALRLYSDPEIPEITEEDFQAYIRSNKN